MTIDHPRRRTRRSDHARASESTSGQSPAMAHSGRRATRADEVCFWGQSGVGLTACAAPRLGDDGSPPRLALQALQGDAR